MRDREGQRLTVRHGPGTRATCSRVSRWNLEVEEPAQHVNRHRRARIEVRLRELRELRVRSSCCVVPRVTGAGNGVFLQGMIEVQVLDSFENITYADGQAGSIYGQYPPMVNVSRKPGEWQSYDIVYRKPSFGEDGKLQQPARITVFHNGVLIQDNVRPLGPTSWLQHGNYSKGEDKRPLSFQDHGNPVRYRNVWVRELPPESIVQPEKPYDPVIVSLKPEQQSKLIGKYARTDGGLWEITEKSGKLYFSVFGTPLEMIPHSVDEFGLKYTAGKIELKYDEAGNPTDLHFHMGGDITKATRAK